jgi:two-component system sensor histidine kinase CreC
LKLGLRLLLGFFLIAGLAAVFVLRVFVAEIKPSVREVMEDIMVDTANLLAEQASAALSVMPAGGTIEDSDFARSVSSYAARPIDARIWGLEKVSLDFRIYATDAAGRVVFDSNHGVAVGQDYSRWNDVARTLRGQYGARASLDVQSDEASGVMYVAAPIKHGDKILGVLTVAKPTATVAKFVERAERKVLVAGAWLFGLSLLVGIVVTAWIVWSVRRLRHYAQHVQAGQPLAVPRLPGELGELAHAMDSMRERLEGREHLEHVVRAFTHELKSPLAAIRGAGELLQDPLPAADRQVFASQIVEQSERLRVIVDRLLELSKLESRSGLEHPVRLDLVECGRQALRTLDARIQQRHMQVRWLRQDEAVTVGDAELVVLAINNLLTNALDFSPVAGSLDLSVRVEETQAVFELRDYGPGVPDYALPQLGQRFYSTPRPEDEAKGSGLGLAIVEQVMTLHMGKLEVEQSRPGLTVRLRFPAA